MKKTLKFLCFALITSMCVVISSCEDPNKNNSGTLGTWVDLGLPSSTKWKAQNEKGYYTYDEAVHGFGDALPTKVQLDELRQNCSWEWRGAGYKVTGPNGNSIILPAAGFRCRPGEVGSVGSIGYYWSSTPDGFKNACSLGFNSYHIYMFYGNRDCGRSVHLIKNPN